ncbi:histidine phosphatase family protein [Roseobacter litoralis]|uniref:histidine phosphatase family protein n=1 Tax=Roseobacter litoralis TaxID=42443 RepID=UPI00249198D3|nr:histidine phosphatase family protein [Roseobacter litoralis]
MQYPSLYILRHGQTEWNAQHRIQGSLDSPLTELGRAQARMQHETLRSCDLTGYRAFCSPQGRAFHTASIALEGQCARVDTDPRLVEIGVGEWEGMCWYELDTGLAGEMSEESALHLYDHAPGGEGFLALRNRCAAFLSDLSGPAVLVTHGVTSRMLRLIILNMGTHEITDLPGGQGIVFHLSGGLQTKL